VVPERLGCYLTGLRLLASGGIWFESGFYNSAWLAAGEGEAGGYAVVVVGLGYTGVVGIVGKVSG